MDLITYAAMVRKAKEYTDQHNPITNLQVTLAAASWSDKSITVTATGVTTSNIIFLAPTPASQTIYTEAQIICITQAENSLTFTCDTVPSSDITVNVVIIG